LRKSINIWSFPPEMPIADCVALAKDAGFEGIELALADEGELSLDASAEELEKIRATVADAGLEISSLATGLFWATPLTADDENVRASALEIGKKLIRTARALGTDAVLVVPGLVGMLWEPPEQGAPYDVVWERAAEAIRELAQTAAENEVYIALENVWNMFLLSPLEFARFVDEIGSPWVGAYFDVGNVVKFGYPEHWIKILGRRIKRVHFKDYRRDGGFPQGFVDLLAGDVNWPAVMSALREVGYDGWVAAEMLPPYKHKPERIIYGTSAAMDAIFEL